MNKKRMLWKIASLALCLTLALHCFSWLSVPVYAAGANSTAYAFGDANGPFRDLYAEYQQEAKQRAKERKKAERKQALKEKAVMKKAAREAREREPQEKTVKKNAGKVADKNDA